jgi:TonB family protein
MTAAVALRRVHQAGALPAPGWEAARPLVSPSMIVAAVVALVLHALLFGAVYFAGQSTDEPDELGTNAIDVDYVRVAPKLPPTDLPAGPNSDASSPSPPVEEAHEIVKDPDLPQATPTESEDPDRIVTPDKRKKPVEEKIETPKAPALASAASVAAEATAMPSSETSAVAPRSAAPEIGSGDSARRVRTTWQRELIAHLEKHRRYPADRSNKQVDIMVTFTLDRTGHVVSVGIATSSGDKTFDEAALAMVRRADPVPAPPALVADEGLTFTLPVEFRSKDRK